MKRWIAPVLAILTTGCVHYVDGVPQVNIRDKSPFQVVQTQYRDVITKMADEIAALVPGLSWDMTVDTWIDGCAQSSYDTGTGEVTRIGPMDPDVQEARFAYFMASFSGPIPDEKWPAAVKVVEDAALSVGAERSEAWVDEPGHHDMHVFGLGEFKLGTQTSSSLTASSDCRIT